MTNHHEPMPKLNYLFILILLTLTACNHETLAFDPTTTPTTTPTVTATATMTDTPKPTRTHTPTATNTATPKPTNTPKPTRTPTLTPTATPTMPPPPTATPIPLPTNTATLTVTLEPISYTGLTIDELSARSYGGGEIALQKITKITAEFTRTHFTYPSDGLNIYGFMNIPKGAGPFPIAVVVHGNLPPELFNTETYTRRYADALARAGYLVLHPNMRTFYPSDDGADAFHVGIAVDVLNLLAIIKQQAGQPGPLQLADSSFIGLMGHSMGGGVALRVSVIDRDLDAVVAYSAMSGNERWNYEKILQWSKGEYGKQELATPDEILNKISPMFYFDRLNASVAIHNGEADGTTIAWGLDLCDRLKGLKKVVECYTYPGQPHIFEGEGDLLFSQRLVDFFNQQRAHATLATPTPTANN